MGDTASKPERSGTSFHWFGEAPFVFLLSKEVTGTPPASRALARSFRNFIFMVSFLVFASSGKRNAISRPYDRSEEEGGGIRRV